MSCTGCGSSENAELTPEDLDNIKSQMDQTKDTLEKMVNSVDNLGVSVDYFSNMEEKINQLSDYLQSGELFKSIESVVKNQKDAQTILMNNLNMMPNQPTSNPTVNVKVPVGWVYVDENGERQISWGEEKPQDVISTALYD